MAREAPRPGLPIKLELPNLVWKARPCLLIIGLKPLRVARKSEAAQTTRNCTLLKLALRPAAPERTRRLNNFRSISASKTKYRLTRYYSWQTNGIRFNFGHFRSKRCRID